MLAPTAYSQPMDTNGVLTLADYRHTLWRFCLPGYNEARWSLQNYQQTGNLVDLWHQVFGDFPPRLRSLWDLSIDFVVRVHNELFPVNLWAMDRMAETWDTPDTYPLDYCIPYQGWGLAWEIVPLLDVPPGAQPVFTAIAEQLAEVYHHELKGLLEDVQAWCKHRNYPASTTWELPPGRDGIDLLRDALNLLDSPLDGLARVVDCILRDTNNIFLNSVDDFYRWEFELEGAFYWQPDDIQILANAYHLGRAEIQQLTDYYEWFNDTSDAETAVLELLDRLTNWNWTIQDGELIYHA